MDVSERIKAIREAKGIKQVEIARTLNIDRSHYHRFENRGNKLTLEQIENIAQALGVSIEELLSTDNKNINAKTESENKLQEEVKVLRTRVKELERDINLSNSRLQDIETLKSILDYEISELTWELAYTKGYITKEEAQQYGVMHGDMQFWGIQEAYWADENGHYPFAFETLPIEVQRKLSDELFSNQMIRSLCSYKVVGTNLISLYDWWSEMKYQEWEREYKKQQKANNEDVQ